MRVLHNPSTVQKRVTLKKGSKLPCLQVGRVELHTGADFARLQSWPPRFSQLAKINDIAAS